MDISFEELKEKEVINIFTGKKLGHIVDFIFNLTNRLLIGIILPGERKFLKKGEDLFIPISQIKRIGDDVILVAINNHQTYNIQGYDKNSRQIRYYDINDTRVNISGKQYKSGQSFVRFKRLNNNKYK